jgi:hypothetical protein
MPIYEDWSDYLAHTFIPSPTRAKKPRQAKKLLLGAVFACLQYHKQKVCNVCAMKTYFVSEVGSAERLGGRLPKNW